MLSHKHSRFERFIEAISRSHSKDRLFDTFIAWMEGYGFDHVNFSVKFDPDLPDACQGFGLFSTYPGLWKDRYADQNYVLIDPVLKNARSHVRPFMWNDLGKRMDLSRRQKNFFGEAEDARLFNGIGIPFKGPRAQIAGIALATSVRRLDVTISFDLLVAGANLFYDRYKDLCSKTTIKRTGVVTLTDREEDVLLRLGHDRTDDQIGVALGMTANTVNSHLRHIYEKLEVHNRAQAVVKALNLGLI